MQNRDLAIDGCPTDFPFLDWKRQTIIERVKNNVFVAGEERHEQFKLLRSYYFPLCLKGLNIDLPTAKGSVLDIEFGVNLNGEPVEITLDGKAVASSAVKERLLLEITRWRFPPAHTPDHISFRAIW